MLHEVVVLSPHRDDEALGVGGTLVYPDKVHIHYFNSRHPNVDPEVYDGEAKAVKNALHCTTSYSKYMGVNHLDQYPLSYHITEIENLLNEHMPDTLLIPAPCRNQDHQTVYQAALVAIRPHDINWYVPTVLLYEVPEYLENSFIPHVYVPIDIQRKIELFKLYQSQQRNYRTPDHIRALAQVRGMQCNEPYAEAFMEVRHTWQPI